MDFFDFYKVMEQPSKDIPIGFAIPGLLYGIEENTVQMIDDVRSALGKDKIDLYCYTWEVEENAPYIDKLVSICENYESVNLILKTEPYNTRENLDFFKRFLSQIGLPVEDTFNLDITNFKRLVPMLAYHKIFKDIFWSTNSNPSIMEKGNPLIFKLKPTLVPQDSSRIQKNFLPEFQDVIQRAQKQVIVPELAGLNHPFDILYSGGCGSYYIDDIFNFSSANTYYNIFCSTLDELADKLAGFYKLHMKDYPYLISSTKDLMPFGNTSKYLTLEGNTILFYLVENAKKKVVYNSLGNSISLSSYYRNILNPIYRIEKGRIVNVFEGKYETSK